MPRSERIRKVGFVVKITLKRNTNEDSADIPYFAHVEIVAETVDIGRVYEVPIYVTYTGLKKKFHFAVCGYEAEARKPHELSWIAKRLIRGLINAGRLPDYVFMARNSGTIYPVYTIDHEVMAVTPGGPVFRHVELAKVREYLGDYLTEISRILGEDDTPDKLHVRGVGRTALELRRPIFYLKKRIVGQVDFWAPVFESGDGRFIYTHAASARREIYSQDGYAILELRKLVAHVLLEDGRLHHNHDLRPDRLQPNWWHKLKPNLQSKGQATVRGVSIELYQHSHGWIGVEQRVDEDRYGLFLGASEADLLERIEHDFIRRGIGLT